MLLLITIIKFIGLLLNLYFNYFFSIPFFFHQAIDGNYIDKKCPFTGNVRIRGRILTGAVRKCKMQRTIVIRRDYLHFVRKYSRFEKRHRNMSVHCSPCFRWVSYENICTFNLLLAQNYTMLTNCRIRSFFFFSKNCKFIDKTSIFKSHP